MGWLAILLAIVQAIPTIIKLVQMIRDLLKDRSNEEKRLVAGELRGILARWRANRNTLQAADDLEGILSRLKRLKGE